MPSPRVSPAQSPTAADHAVLALLLTGVSDKIIARHLQITPTIAKKRVARALRRIGVRGRSAGAVWAAQRGIAPPAGIVVYDLPPLHHALSARERDCLCRIASGHDDPTIALQLGISLGAVKHYVGNALRKLQVTNRTQAAVRAVQLGLVVPFRPE